MRGWKRELILAGAVFLVSSLSFAAGYLSNRESGRAAIVIEKCGDRAAK